MGTTSEELKRLYSNLGGDDKDTAKTQSPVEVLKKIYEYLGGENPNAKNVQQTGDILNKFNEMDIKLCVDERFYPPIIDEVEGNPVTFSGSEAPLVRCDVDLKPQQDLHGYTKPWVGGANGMLWDETIEIGSINTSTGQNILGSDYMRSVGYIPVQPNTEYYCYYYNSITTYGLIMFWYDSNHEYLGTSNSYGAITSPDNAYYARFRTVRQYGTTYNHDICFNYPSMLTTYRSYSNICPISGYSSVGVGVAGKNLFDISDISNGYIDENGVIIPNNDFMATGLKIVSPSMSYTMSYYRTSTSNKNGIRIAWYDENESFIRRDGVLESTSVGAKSTTATAPANAKYARISLVNSNYGTDYQFEAGSTATDYEPYAGHTYTIALGDTYYSGHIDAVRGVLVADKAGFICDGTESGWSKSTTTVCDVYMATSPFSAFNFNNAYVTDKFAYTPERNYNTVGYTWRGSSSKQLRVGFAEYNTSTLASFKTWLGNNPLQIVADLETPIEIPLTPTEIFALQGINTMWTNADSLDVEYITDNWNIFHPTIETKSSTKRKSTKPTRNLVLRVPIEDIEPTVEDIPEPVKEEPVIKEDDSEPTKEESVVKEDILEPAKEEPVVKKSVKEEPATEEVVTDEQQSVRLS